MPEALCCADRRPHVRVERGHRLRRLIDDGDGDPASHSASAISTPMCRAATTARRGCARCRSARSAVPSSRVCTPNTPAASTPGEQSHRDRAGRDTGRSKAFPNDRPAARHTGTRLAARSIFSTSVRIRRPMPLRRCASGERATRRSGASTSPATQYGMPQAESGTVRSALERDDLDPRRLRFAWPARLRSPAASAPMTTIRSVMGSVHPTAGPRRRVRRHRSGRPGRGTDLGSRPDRPGDRGSCPRSRPVRPRRAAARAAAGGDPRAARRPQDTR